MRIAIVSGTFHPEPGGPPTYLYRLAANLVARGHRVRVATYGERSPGGHYPYPVARVMSRLRLVQGVTQVSLASSEKAEASSSGAASGSGSGSGGGGSNDCRNGSSKFPQFSMVVFFSPLPGAATGAPSTGTPSTGAAPSSGAKASSGNGGTATAANNSGAIGAASGGTGK